MKKSRVRPRRKGKRTGFTTGACAAAAARAAALGLARGAIPAAVECRLPNGNAVSFEVTDPVLSPDKAQAAVVKDAGDDPDCTHGAHITATVRKLPGEPGTIHITGGPGVGTVTRPGLGLTVGEAAINPVPRQNIADNLRSALPRFLAVAGLEASISVPDGEERAKKTLNTRLGIVGGISILGTSGIVIPYSTSAYKASVVQAVNQLAAEGFTTVVFTTGRRTERFAQGRLLGLEEHHFVQMGDFVGAALESAGEAGMNHVVIAAMAGKLAKIAQGVANTHAHKTTVDMDLVAGYAQAAGADAATVEEIRNGTTVRYAAERMGEEERVAAFFQHLVNATAEAARRRLPESCSLTVLGFDYEGQFLAASGEAEPHG